MEVFRPEADVGIGDFSGRVDKERLLSILDVNSVLAHAQPRFWGEMQIIKE